MAVKESGHYSRIVVGFTRLTKVDAHAFLVNAVAYLAVAVLVVPLVVRARLGSVLGYLAAGLILGPQGFHVVADPQASLHFAEFGVVLLLFLIGLELKPDLLWRLRQTIFGLGALQVMLTSLLLFAALLVSGLNSLAAGLLAFSFSLSSTAIVLQMLTERGERNTGAGRAIFGILLFQDIIVIPAMVILPLMSDSRAGMDSWFLPRAAVAILGVIYAGRLLSRPVFRIIARTNSRDLFTAFALFLVFGVALIMETVGLSMALGSFLAGVLLAESEYRHELEASIEPFKGLLLGMFFISIGMLVDLRMVWEKPLVLLGAVLALIILKALAGYAAARLMRQSGSDQGKIAIAIAQGGEFAFVLLTAGAAAGIIGSEETAMGVNVVAFSLLLAPFATIIHSRFIARSAPEAQDFDEIDELNPVIIAGYGRFGQMVARVLRLSGIPFTALELDAAQVEVVRRFGFKIYHGDASRLDLLEAAGAGSASLFVLAIDDTESSVRTAEVVRSHFPELPVLARARNRSHVYQLRELGIPPENIFRETLGSSLEAAVAALSGLGFDPRKARNLVQRFRDHDEELLDQQYTFRHDQEKFVSFSRQAANDLDEVFRKDAEDARIRS